VLKQWEKEKREKLAKKHEKDKKDAEDDEDDDDEPPSGKTLGRKNSRASLSKQEKASAATAKRIKVVGRRQSAS
jgi:hypothetical protein